MKRFVIFILVFGFIFLSLPAYSAKETKGASQQAYEHASENSIFNRVSDWFATVGKSDEEKAKILEERKQERARKRLEKEAKKASQAGEKARVRTREEAQESKGKAKKVSTKIKGMKEGLSE